MVAGAFAPSYLAYRVVLTAPVVYSILLAVKHVPTDTTLQDEYTINLP